MFRLFFVFFVFFAGCLLGVCNLFRMLWQSVRSIIAICTPRIRNPFAAKWQVVSSRRGPIYRARVYEYTHKMGDECTFAMKFMYIFNNVEIRI